MREKPEVAKKGGMKTIKRIFNVLGVIVLLLLMTLCAFLIYQRATGQEPNLFGYRFFEVQSASMEPTIMTGNTILTKDYKNASKIEINDIVIFKNDAVWDAVGKPQLKGNYLVHRVVGMRMGEDGKTYITTKGDNNRFSDPETEISLVEAKYLKTVSSGFFKFLRSPFGIVALIAGIVAIFIGIRLVYALKVKAKAKKEALRIAQSVSVEESDNSVEGSNNKDIKTEDVEAVEQPATEIIHKKELGKKWKRGKKHDKKEE